MTDNFDRIQNIIDTYRDILTDDDFYWVQIIKRRKDSGNELMQKENLIIDNFFFDSRKSFQIISQKDRIVQLCNQNNARAYIWFNRRSYKKVALQAMAMMADRIANGNYHVKDVYLSACGKFPAEKNYLVDVDGDVVDKRELIEYIKELLIEAGKHPEVHEIPTRNGYHLIASPFNVAKFSTKYPDISVHKENPTILYI